MSNRWTLRWITVAVAALGIAALGSCGSSSKSTTPAGGGGAALELNSGTLAGNGGSYSHAFMNAGTFPYHCAIHAGMTGTVTVNSAGATAETVCTVSAMNFDQPTRTINVGQTVRWRTTTATAHTVTSD